MGFFDGLKKVWERVTPWDEEEKRRKQQAQNQQSQNQGWRTPMKAPDNASYNAPTNQNPQRRDPLDPMSLLPNNGVSLPSFLKTPNTAGGFPAGPKKAPDPAEKQRALDELTRANLEKAKKEREQGEGFLGRNFLNKGAIERDAEVVARSRATNQYQEKNGYNRDSVVVDFGKETLQKANRSGDILRGQTKKADKAQEIAQWVPLVGSALNLGLAKAENDARASGNTGTANAVKAQRDKNEFGMSQEEMNALDPEVRRKLQVVRELGYAASPLDVLGLGGLAKSGAIQTAKTGAKQLIKEGAVDAATRQAIKEAAKTSGKSLAKNTAVGTGITLGGQQYLAGEMNAPEALKSGLMIGGATQLFEGSNLRKAAIKSAVSGDPDVPGVNSVNPNRRQDMMQAEIEQLRKADENAALRAEAEDIDTPAYQRAPAKEQLQNVEDDAYLAREREFDAENTTLLDTPAFERRGQALPGQAPDQQIVTDNLRNNANDFASDPAAAPIVSEAFNATGSNDPLSLVTNVLSRTNNKGQIRAIVQRLVPDADGNALNRAVNSITGADNTPDILEALHVAAARSAGNEPFGAVSTAPAPIPAAPANPGRQMADGNTLMPDGRVFDPEGNYIRTSPPIPMEEMPTPPIAPMVDEAAQPVASTVPATFENAPVLQKAPEQPAAPVKGTPENPYKNAAEAQAATKAASQKEGLQKAVAGTDTAAPVKAKPLPKTAQRDLPAIKQTETAKTGEVGKSKGKYAKGQEYEKTSLEATRERGAEGASTQSYDTFVKKIEDADGMTGADRDAAVALQARQKPGTPEHRRLGDLINKYHTEASQTLATIERTIRKTADANRLTDRFVNKLYASTDDTVKISDKDFDGVIAKNEAYTKARDEQNAAVEAFNTNPTDANVDRVTDAFKAADKADRAAKFEEYKVAAKLGKKSSNPKTKAFVKKLEQEAGVYTMDWVDSSMLSSTRVMLNNFINTLTVRGEEALFGKAGAALARKLTKTDIGGGSHKGAKLGAQLGTSNWQANTKLRQGAEGNKLVKSVKNFTTSGNTIGDRNTFAAAYSGVYDHYRAGLKKAGYKGDELDRRAMVNSLADPDNIAFDYMNQALASNAMASTISGVSGGKMETRFANKIAEMGGNSAAAKIAGKAITRVVLGFPTVIARSLAQGAKRATAPVFGGVSTVQAIANVVRKGPPEVTAKHIKNAVKEAGSGAVMYAVGAGLGAKGLITGAYPTDKAEQERWKREGITENSIKIGDDYYSLPAGLGVMALPFMIGANTSTNVAEGKKITDDFIMDTVKTVANAAPTDSLAKTIDFIADVERGRDVTKYLTATGAGLTRAITPLGSLVNQVGKMFDPTANDTTQGEAMAQFLAKIQDGIPGLTNKLPDKEVDGKVIKNPGAIPKLFGASSTSQSEGVQKTSEIRQSVNAKASKLAEAGAFNDKIRNILDDETKVIFDKAKNGKELSDDDVNKLNSGVTKGVTEDSDTRFLEDGDYDNNLAVLKAKKALLEADPTTRKDTITAYDQQITRGEIYKEQKTKYENIKKYKEIDLTEWRKLGDPDDEDHNAELYETLFDLDAAMTDKGVSRRSSDPTKPKYYAKETKGRGGGRGGRGGRGGGGGSSENAELKRIQSNTVGSPDTLSKFSFGDLRPEKANTTKIPTIQEIRSSDLVKKRKIKVGKA